MREISLVPITL